MIVFNLGYLSLGFEARAGRRKGVASLRFWVCRRLLWQNDDDWATTATSIEGSGRFEGFGLANRQFLHGYSFNESVN